jgi:hypothetical protein
MLGRADETGQAVLQMYDILGLSSVRCVVNVSGARQP